MFLRQVVLCWLCYIVYVLNIKNSVGNIILIYIFYSISVMLFHWQLKKNPKALCEIQPNQKCSFFLAKVKVLDRNQRLRSIHVLYILKVYLDKNIYWRIFKSISTNCKILFLKTNVFGNFKSTWIFCVCYSLCKKPSYDVLLICSEIYKTFLS